MGFLDNLKARLGPAKEKVGDKVGDLAHQHGGKIGQGLDKAARTVDEKTKGKYSDKIQSGTRKAKDTVDRLGHKDAPVRARRRASTARTRTPPPPAH